MSHPLLSICASCRWQLSRVARGPHTTRPGLSQIRGKKKNARPSGIIEVRLLQDLPGYGPKGTLVPLPTGRMRNIFYPQRKADYIPYQERNRLKKSGTILQRDASYQLPGTEEDYEDEGAEIKETVTSSISQPARPTRQPTQVRVDIDRLQPIEAFNILSRSLPPSLNFYRAPIETPDAAKAGETPQPDQPGIPGPSASMYPDRTTSIYGSVTTLDVATNLKALIAANEDMAGRLVLNAEDIRIVSGTDDESRAKHIGDFDIEISVKGVAQPVRRQIRVIPEEQAPEDIEAGNQAVEELAAEAEQVPEGLFQQDAENEHILERAENVKEDSGQLLDAASTMTEDLKETPAEAAERGATGEGIHKQSGPEGILEGDEDRTPPIQRMKPEDARR